MKRLLPCLWLACFLLLGMNAQAYEYTINGTINFGNMGGGPVPFGFVMATTDTGDTQAIETDETGLYSLTFDIEEGTVATITVTTIDWCTGEELSTIVTTDTSPATVDFDICADFADCGAWFDYYPSADDPLTVNFNNASWGAEVTSFEWDLGDGTTSTEENPIHTYAEEGVYEVTLTITAGDCTSTEGYPVYVGETNNNPCGCDDGGEQVCVDLGIGFPIPFPNACWALCEGFSEADFIDCDFEPTDCWASFYYLQDDFGSLEVSFFDDSFGEGITSWSWDFGDGNTSTEQNPVHEYAEGGVFDVTLTITGEDDCESSILQHICIFDFEPTECEAFFGYSMDGSLTVQFDDFSWGENITSWAWDFGDGNTSNDQYPSNTYAEEGEYIVSLTIESDSCTSTFVQPIWLFNGGGGGDCDAFFFYFELDENTVQFENISSGDITSWSWDFGDGNTSEEPNPVHTYAEGGEYIVTLTVTGEDCTNTFEELVWIWGGNGCGCDADFDPVCVNDPVTGITLWFSNACFAECEGYTEDQFVECDGGGNECEAFFLWIEEGENTITFIDLSQGADTWAWDFGDGNTSTESNPIHTYAEAGEYVVTLTISSEDCTSSFIFDIVVGNNGGCICDSVFDPVCVEDPVIGLQLWFSNACFAECEGYTEDQFVECDGNGGPWDECWASFDYYPIDSVTVQFNDYSFENVTSWLWDFGDGNTSTEQNPIHTYATGGIYDVTLTIETADGCTSTSTYHICIGDEVIDFEFPECQAFFFFEQDNDDLLNFQFLDFSFGSNITAWAWDFGDGNSSTEQNPAHTYSEAGLYTVMLTITSDECESSFPMIVMTDFDIWYNGECSALFLPLVTEGDNLVTFLNLSSEDAVEYSWDFGDGTTSTDANPEHTYAESGTYEVVLTITTIDGCVNSMAMTVNLGEGEFGGIAQSVVTTSTKELENIKQLTLYPNPVVNTLTIALDATQSGDYQVEIVNLAGQSLQSKVANVTLGNNQLEMNVSDLPAGIYFARLKNEKESLSLKFIK